jgi:hypothetical protein
MEISQHMHGICSALGELALPRAFQERKLDRFVAWNSRFLKTLSISEEEVQAVNASEILSIQGEGIEINGGFRMIPCSPLVMRREMQIGRHVITTEGTLETRLLFGADPASRNVSWQDSVNEFSIASVRSGLADRSNGR